MKTAIALFLSLFMISSCACQKNTDMKTAVIEYEAQTRGMYQKVLVENQTVFVAKNRDEKPVELKISDEDWIVLTTEFEKLDLEAIPNLKAPTEKRFYDGAAIANLKITYKGKTYETKAFDHGFPPAEIKKIVTKLVSFTQK
ncbi:hypothetical protein [Flavobacterium lacustre]|uniref:hypothetical protein n=1 Tax=Flavobacterium lacustre TaxID=3016339 RepID=UPI0022B5F6BC|nr:hypothetical protein [Flavobacterium lacustre]